MSLQQIKNMKDQRGFTIVELLIVIVVIGILAAIVIVAYNGVQNQARTTKGKSNASTLQKRAEGFYADDNNPNAGSYPTDAAAWNTYSGTNQNSVGSVPSTITVGGAALGSATDTLHYRVCTGGGYRISYWDYTANSESTAAKSVNGGGADQSSTCS